MGIKRTIHIITISLLLFLALIFALTFDSRITGFAIADSVSGCVDCYDAPPGYVWWIIRIILLGIMGTVAYFIYRYYSIKPTNAKIFDKDYYFYKTK